MNYSELKEIFRELKRTSPRKNLTAHIIFTEDSFTKQYPLLSRTYRFTSDNKAFWPSMGGYSIFAYCLDKTSDQGVRLDWYMEEEGNPGGWKAEDCYVLEQMRDVEAMSDLIRLEMDDETMFWTKRMISPAIRWHPGQRNQSRKKNERKSPLSKHS